MVEAGLVTWCVLIGLNGIVLGYVRHQRQEHPYLFAYLLYRLVRSTVIFPVYYAAWWFHFPTHLMNTYGRLYWATDPPLIALSIFALCELSPTGKHAYWKKFLYAMGSGALLLQSTLVLLRNDAAVKVEGYTWIFCACVAAIAMLRGANLLAAGFVMLNFFPAISGRMEVLLHGEGLRMVPVFSLAAAYCLWIRWAYLLHLEREITT